MDHNPFLAASQQSRPGQVAGKGHIERPEEARNIVWQTRDAPPSAYENQLGDALEVIFGAGVEDLPTLVARLDEMGVRDPSGQAWTEDSFAREMRRLGA